MTKPRGQRRKKLERQVEALKRFGANLRQARLGARWTQEQLAEAAGYSVAHISLLERGGRNPPVGLVFRLAAVIDTPVESLVQGL